MAAYKPVAVQSLPRLGEKITQDTLYWRGYKVGGGGGSGPAPAGGCPRPDLLSGLAVRSGSLTPPWNLLKGFLRSDADLCPKLNYQTRLLP